jgi:predicted nuclease of predicted toxin-antitoxin system
MGDPFLIDECLSPRLVGIANQRGYQATHVVHRGLRGTQDHDLMPLIRSENFIFVTRNARDFLRLYAREPVHAGLVLILPGSALGRDQVGLFDIALTALADMPDLINKVMEVFSDGSVQVSDLPITPA